MRTLLTFLLAAFTMSLSAQVDCPNTFDNNSDGAVTINDLLDLLGVFGDSDTDSDGIWDSVEECVDLSACNFIDALGNCGGGCEAIPDRRPILITG
jgi:hypothetical protein